MKKSRAKRRHVLGEGWTRYATIGLGPNGAVKVWLVAEEENRGYQPPVILNTQLWDKKVRLVLEEI